jgi:hypothetical protein
MYLHSDLSYIVTWLLFICLHIFLLRIIIRRIVWTNVVIMAIIICGLLYSHRSKQNTYHNNPIIQNTHVAQQYS